MFSGAGGLDMAVQRVFGGEVAWHSEVDPAASKVLAHRFPDVPNLGDITTVDWAAVEPVDVLCGGFPCQDVSAAGRRAGIKDGTRSGLWAMFADAIAALKPSIVVIENVRGLLNAQAHRDMESVDAVVGDRPVRPVLRAAGAVCGDLADLGYDAQWATVSAASVGAPHRRERVFIVATAADTESIGRRVLHTKDKRQTDREVNALADHRVPAAFSSGDGRHEGRPEPTRLVGGSDAALSGDGPVDLLPTPTAQSAKHDADDRGLGTLDDHNLWSVAARIGRGELLPTPRATRGGSNTETVELLPTPRGADGNGGGNYNSPGHQDTLPGTVRLLPTPCSRDYKDASASPGAVARNTPSLGAVEFYLPTPAAADGNRGQDFARANREGSGGDDLVTLAVKATRDSQWGKYAPAIRRWEQVTRPAPSPTEPNRNGNPRLAPAFSEWMLGWPEGWVTQVPGISRNDQLRIVGNGVCPAQAEAALRYLLSVAEVAA